MAANQSFVQLPFLGKVDTNPELKPFWDATAEGKMLLRQCQGCDRLHWYPRAFCPFCFGSDVEWVPARGGGVIYTFTEVKAEVPYLLAYVLLDEGLTVMTNLVGCSANDVQIGQNVWLDFAPSDKGPPLPVFSPVPD